MRNIIRDVFYTIEWRKQEKDIYASLFILGSILTVILAFVCLLELYHAWHHLTHDKRPTKALLHIGLFLSCLVLLSIIAYGTFTLYAWQ